MRRDWAGPRAKVDSEFGACRICMVPGAEAAHIIARSRVRPGPAEDPLNIVPLCRDHHRQYDEGDLDLLPSLSLAEQGYVASLVGLVTAVERTTNRRWRAIETGGASA